MLWIDNLDVWKSTSLISGTPDLNIETDATHKGLGILHGGSDWESVVPKGIPATHHLPRIPGRSLCK